ncbi:LytR/AlgR family response regulator transcription factor [Arcticibacterium luteifluviistationis]|uniref:DNA-binding response regulator n=1 Tax=Arcticibacterium luteifluviistationis TaxID=1784714 RepID=A0A2Z4GGC8_9BACT|nr:LytTR family DNA-binding domain-containing protein [Arcticibacterium luteifluviistationis]AWW00463.1 hypothetical protein DJ013_20690 [Arcticibacterium luteifluviistationis]
MKYTAILVDDEQHAIRTLTAQLGWTKLPIEILGFANSVDEAETLLIDLKPDFLFLDIKMPGKESFELFPLLDLKVTDVIFTTAYDEYALKAFKHQASGYLMKPVSTKELTSLLEKLISKRGVLAEGNQDLYIEEKSGLLRIPLNDILYISSEGSYSSIHKIDGSMKVVTSILKDLEKKLSSKQFFRIHNQYIVNTAQVSEVIKSRNAELVLKNAAKLPISRAKKAAFYSFFEGVTH